MPVSPWFGNCLFVRMLVSGFCEIGKAGKATFNLQDYNRFNEYSGFAYNGKGNFFFGGLTSELNNKNKFFGMC